MAQTPDEKTYVEIPLVEELTGMGWNHIEGDIDVQGSKAFITPDIVPFVNGIPRLHPPQRPVNRGGLFSRKAVFPSWWSRE